LRNSSIGGICFQSPQVSPLIWASVVLKTVYKKFLTMKFVPPQLWNEARK